MSEQPTKNSTTNSIDEHSEAMGSGDPAGSAGGARGNAPRGIERYGLGQSGYTAGRVEGDRALGLEGRNPSYPRGTDEHVLGLGLDDRFTGCGGPPWPPQAPGS